jgi:hypothetical protein
MRSLVIRATLAALALALTACSGGESQRKIASTFTFPVEIDVNVSEDDEVKGGLARVPVKVDDKVIGYTDKDGKFSAYIQEKPGAEVQLSLGSMNGWVFENDSSTNQLRVKRGVDNKPNPIPLKLSAKAMNIELDYLVWVKLDCPEDKIDPTLCADIPIKLDGQEVARTALDGRAHFSSRAPIESKHTVEILTPKFDQSAEEPAMVRPPNPTYTLKLDELSEVFILEQTLVDAIVLAGDNDDKRKTGRRTKRKGSKKPKRRITNKKKDPPKKKKDPPKKKKEDDDTISIFD